MQNPQRGRFIVSAITFTLAIVILILATLNYVRITQIDNSPEDGVTIMRPSSTPTAPGAQTTPVASPTTEVATSTAGETQSPTDTSVPTAAPTLATATIASTATEETSFPTATIDLTPTPSTPSGQSLFTLSRAVVPARDLYAIAARLRFKNTDPIPHTTDRPAGDYAIGHSDPFFIADLPAKRYYTITATIKEVTEHAYWYAEDGKSVDLNAIKRASSTFESSIHPTNRRIFGTEWDPGVDNDPRITVLFASVPGAGGYFTSADEYTRAVNPYSNEREMIYINTDTGWGNLESTLAHEYQHMIHWNQHPNHDVWLNEGASMLAQDINGYSLGGVDNDFMRDPDTQLNTWQSNPDLARANYGASFLFLDFLRTYYGGDDVIHALVASQGGGTTAVDAALRAVGRTETFVDVFKRWTLANLLDDVPGASEDKLEYPDRSVQMSLSAQLTDYPAQTSGSVSQFGTDYIQLAPPPGGSTLHVDFKGAPDVPVIAAKAHSGTGIYWSNRGDLADSTLTRRIDLSSVSSATLDFYVWFDLETDLDYGYVELSTDNGITWDTLKGEYTTDTNPNGTNFGNGYTSKSSDVPGADGDGWLHESIDIDKYAGNEVLLRFEYITDDGYNAGGLAVDDISIQAVNLNDDAEITSPDWEESGWVRLANSLPQSYYVAVVKYAADNSYTIQDVEVADDGTASFDLTGTYDSAIMLVSGITPYNIQKSEYSLNVTVK